MYLRQLMPFYGQKNKNMKNSIVTLCIIILAFCFQHTYGQNQAIDSAANELASKYEHIQIVPPLIIVNNGGKKKCITLKNKAGNDDEKEICTFKEGKTGIYFFGYDSLIKSVPLKSYQSLIISTESESFDILSATSLNEVTDNFLLENLQGYIIIKTGEHYTAQYFEGKTFISKTKNLPKIDTEMLWDNHYWNLKEKYDHVHKISPFYIVNRDGKKECHPLPVTQKTEVIEYPDPETGELIQETVQVKTLNEICFFQKGETGVYFAEESLANVVPADNYDAIYIPFNVGEINITANPNPYNFSRDSVPFELKCEFGYLNFNNIIASKKGLYSAFNITKKTHIKQVKGIAPYGWDEFIIFKRGSFYFSSHESEYPIGESGGMLDFYDIYPFPVLAQSDLKLWEYEKQLKVDYTEEYFGDFPVKFSWRHQTFPGYNDDTPFTYLVNNGGEVEVFEDTVYKSFIDYNFEGERQYNLDSSFLRTATVQGGSFATADNQGNILMSDLSEVSMWGIIYNSKGEKSWINAPAGSGDFFKMKNDMHYLSFRKKKQYQLMFMEDEYNRLITDSPVEVVRTTTESGYINDYCLVQKEGKWGLIDCRDGFLVVDYLYTNLEDVPLSSVSDWQKTLVKALRKKFNADLIVWDEGNGDGIVKIRNKEINKWGMYHVYDEKNIEEIIPMQYDSLNFFSVNGNVTPVYRDGKVGFYLSKFSYGEEAKESVACIYDEFQNFWTDKPNQYGGHHSALYIAVKRNGMWGWIDWKTGEEKSEFKYSSKESLPAPHW